MKRKLLAGIAALAVFAALVLSFVKAERFRSRIHRALEDSLHRKVDIDGKVTFSIWNGPGFSITDVAIHEDPLVGIEPFAYVSSLDASLSIPAMLTGKWRVATIVLDEPTVTLSQSIGGTWNVRRLLGSEAAASIRSALPEIRVRGGRINLKFGDMKSVLYFLNADMDLNLEEDGLRIRFSMEPARSDRPAQGFGTLRGRGRYVRKNGEKGNVDLDLDLERSALSEVATLLEGRGTAFRGFLAARSKVQGPLDALRIEGSLRVEDIQRWDLLRAATGSWPVQFRGRFDFPAGELDLETSGNAGGPFRLRLLGHSLMENPSWGAIASCRDLPISALTDLVQYLGPKLPERITLDGKVNGVLGYSRKHGLQGMMELPEAAVKGAGATFTLRQARFALDGEQFRLLPARLVMAGGGTAEIEGQYGPDGESFVMRTNGESLPLRETLGGYHQLLGVPVPLLGATEEGSWRGAIRYERVADERPKWTSQFAVSDARFAVDGLASPVVLQFAAGAMQGSRVSVQGMKGSVGEIAFTGSYREEPAATHPKKLQLRFEELDAAALETVFNPTLRRSSLLRTLGLRSAVLPQWLKDRHLEAAVQINALYAGDNWLGGVAGDLSWDGGLVRFRDLNWSRDESAGAGTLTIQLARAEPSYHLAAEVKNFRWKGGAVDGEVDVTTSGSSTAILRNARSLGKFLARDLSFPAESEFRTAAGHYELSAGRGGPLLKLDGIEVSCCGGEIFTGRGGSEADGRFAVDLASGRKKLRMSGTLWPFQLEIEPAAAR